jgi:hypothetical protein
MLTILFISASVLIMAVIVEALRRRRLSENFALLWLGVGVAAVLLALLRPLFDRISDAVGVSYGPALLFALIIVFLLLLCLVLSIHITRLRRQVELLAQDLAVRSVRSPDVETIPTGPDDVD